MANTAFDFLADSFLFDDRYIEENYKAQTEKELVSELTRYREHIRNHFDEIISEVQSDTELNVSIETLDSLPDEQLLKQLAMYLDKVVISDPIFEISLDIDNTQLDFGELLNLKRENRFQDFDEKTMHFSMKMYVPDTISESEFRVWVNKSINQAAIGEFERTFNEVMFAEKMKCMYLAKTSFTAELLQQSIAKKNIETDLANLSMKLELPFIHNIALPDLISIRYDNGESFHNFRNTLNSKLLELRDIDDKDVLAAKLENISYELSTINVAEVNKEYRKILRSLGTDAVLLTGSLLTNYFIGGLTLIGAAGAIVKGSADYIKYLNEVKENNGYFIWKLSKK